MWGREKGRPPSAAHPSGPSSCAAFPRSLARASSEPSTVCVTWCHSSYAPPSVWMTITANSPMLSTFNTFSLPPGGSHHRPDAQ